MEKGNVLYAKKGEYRFQEVFFNGHPANKQNPNPHDRYSKVNILFAKDQDGSLKKS